MSIYPGVEEKLIYTLDETSVLINKWLEKSYDESESEIEASSNWDSYFSDESDTKTIDFVAPNEHLDNSASISWGNPEILTLMLELDQLLIFYR